MAGGVTNIEWTPSGKVRKVTKSTGSPIEFRYDASGNRVVKKQGTTITRYIRDASGNVMAVYQADTLSERPIYGSSRLGNLGYASKPGYRTVGYKQYELSNHLGNVLAVVSDRIHIDSQNTWAEVLSRSDYYPFGLEMTGRTESNGYRYGFNGKEKDPSGEWSNQSHYDYSFRIYNPTIGKFLSVDPLTKSYPWYTPYQFAGNNPIKFIDLDGLEEYDPQRDSFFTARLLLTTFYDIKYSAENLILNKFVTADPGMKWQASYKVNESGEEIFETIIRQIPHQGALKETFNTSLDVVNIVAAGRLDPTDFISVRTGGNTQLTRGLRKLLDPTGFRQLPIEGLIDQSSIRFSQGSISPNFRNGSSIDDLILGLRNGSIDPLSVDSIRIVERNGEIFTLDNRRLKAFQEAGVDIPFKKLDEVS